MSEHLEADIRAAANLPPVDDTPATTVLPVRVDVPANRLGKYILHELIGCGGMARVDRATQGGSDMSVAVKSCRVGEDGRVLWLRFRREIAIMAELIHDNIVRLHDADEDNGRPFLVMELLVGSPLNVLLRRGPMRTANACEIARQIAAGLTCAHSRGVVHRDIKPGNAFLTSEGVVKILDWGLAKQEGQSELTYSGQGGGTPDYMPREQRHDMRSVDARADVYSLGVTLWALLAGHTPAEGEAVPEGLAPNLGALLRHMTAPSPADRPATAREVADALVPFAVGHDLPPLVGRPASLNGANAGEPRSGSSIVADLPTKPDTPAVDVGRKSLRISRWALVLGVLLVASVFAVWMLTRPTPPADTTAVRYTGTVDLMVPRTDENGSEDVYHLSDPRAMPLRSGDHVKIIATVNPAAFVYLFWVDEAGKPSPLYPWVPLQWGTRRPADERVKGYLEIKDPQDNWFKIVGDGAGMETILMLTWPEPLSADDTEIQGWFQGLQPLRFPGERARVWFQGFEPVKNDLRRAIEYGGELGEPGGPLRLQDTLRKRIGTRAGFSAAVSFARVGKKGDK